MNRSYVLQAFIETPWAILPSKLAMLEEIVIRHVAGEKLEAAEIQARIQGEAARPQDRQVQSVAVLPLFGTIIPRADFFDEASGATSAEKFGKQFAKLLADPTIDAIVIDCNSPGGQVGGIPELSQQIFNARGTKPIIAVANQMMASAAYWICTSADEVVVTPSADVGSVGVFAVHNDISAALDKAGMKLSIISAGKYKVEANPWQPLTPEAQASIQASVDEVYDAFVTAIARNRGVSPDAVRNGFGEGRVVSASQAVALGMADRIETLDETINRLLGGQAPTSQTSAMQSARARLVAAAEKTYQGDSNMLRNLLKARADKVARAQQLADTADKESRDFTDEERAEFVQLLGEAESTGEVGALDTQIETIQGERERLRAAADRKFTTGPGPQKPENTSASTMKRADFEKLDETAQAAFIRGRGKLED